MKLTTEQRLHNAREKKLKDEVSECTFSPNIKPLRIRGSQSKSHQILKETTGNTCDFNQHEELKISPVSSESYQIQKLTSGNL